MAEVVVQAVARVHQKVEIQAAEVQEQLVKVSQVLQLVILIHILQVEAAELAL